MSLEFYTSLSPITQFEDVAKLTQFARVPDDWSVVLSDIQGSTQAIEAGRYKEVNMIGAATIAAIKNAIGTRNFPFVFGGDGATALLPRELCEKIVLPLQKLQRMAAQNFGFTLRVGIVPMSEVSERGGKVLLAKYEMSPNNYLAMFQGGGLQVAEQVLKKEPQGTKYFLPKIEGTSDPELQSLSCRWSPIENRNGTIVSVLIQAVAPDQATRIYDSILKEINPIFDAETFRPVSMPTMKMEKFWASFQRERKFRQDLKGFDLVTRILIPMILTRLPHHFPWLPGFKPVVNYLADTAAHSDYKKLDDALRMVLDCSIKQAQQLEEVLRRHHALNEIYFGVHYSSSALMTCMVESIAPGEHIHFIDGSDGGYTFAARAMKQQMRTRQSLAG